MARRSTVVTRIRRNPRLPMNIVRRAPRASLGVRDARRGRRRASARDWRNGVRISTLGRGRRLPVDAYRHVRSFL